MKKIHESQIALDVPEPGRLPPPPAEAYAEEFGHAALVRQRAAYEASALCKCDQGDAARFHRPGCPRWRKS